jgi:hypothetical protein
LEVRVLPRQPQTPAERHNPTSLARATGTPWPYNGPQPSLNPSRQGVATVREKRPGVCEVRVYFGRDPVTQRPKQVSRYVHAGPRTKAGRPPKAVTDLEHQLEPEAAAGKLGGTSATVRLLIDRYLEHLIRQRHPPMTFDT